GRPGAAGDRRGRRNDVGTVDRRGGGGRVGERLVETVADAGSGLRIRHGPAGIEGGHLGRARLLRGGDVIPEAAGVDDIGGRLRLRLGFFGDGSGRSWRREDFGVGGRKLQGGGGLGGFLSRLFRPFGGYSSRDGDLGGLF